MLYDTDPTHIKEQQEKAVAEADKLIANKILDMIRTMLCKDREVQSFEYTEARKAYFTEQMICEILIALEQAAMSFDMEYDDRQKAMSTELSKAARKEWYLRHKDKGSATAKASPPEMRTMPMPPGAGAVEMAAMVFSIVDPLFHRNFKTCRKVGPPAGRPTLTYFFSIRP